MAYTRGLHHIYRNDKEIVFSKNGFLFHMPNSVIDEYVVMRYAEMTPSSRSRAEKRAIKKHYGNFGCEALARKHGLKSAVENVQIRLGKQRKKDEIKEQVLHSFGKR